MEEQFYADRVRLRQLLEQYPKWTQRAYADAIGRSVNWVRKWKPRIQQAEPEEMDEVLRGQSRRPHHIQPSIHEDVVKRILEIRDDPPQELGRIPGPRAIIYYLHQDEALQNSGHHLPTSTRTIWRILDQHQRIQRRHKPEHQPMERPEPMSSWQIDFKDVSTVPADPEGKQQHVVETLNVVDVGTSLVLDAVVRDDFASDTAIWAAVHATLLHGLPHQVTFDRDPRFVGSWSGRDFPAPFMRFWMTLGVQVNICPPRRPDKNAFVERYHRSYQQECLANHRPATLEQSIIVTERYVTHYNHERPNQAITCNNQPPARAFESLPILPPLPETVDPNAWLKQIDGQCYTRRIDTGGRIQVDNHRYYVKRALAGQYVVARIDAANHQLVIEHRHQVIKSHQIVGVHDEDNLPFADYFEYIQDEAREHWRRVMRQLRRSRSRVA